MNRMNNMKCFGNRGTGAAVVLLLACLWMGGMGASAQKQGTQDILGTWDLVTNGVETGVYNGMAFTEAFVDVITFEFLASGIARIFEDDECPEDILEAPYVFSGGTLSIDNAMTSNDMNCDLDQRDDCVINLSASIDASGRLAGTIDYHCEGEDANGVPWNEGTVSPASFFAYRRPEAGASGNAILGAWDVTINTVESGEHNGQPFGPLNFTIRDVWVFGPDGLLTVVELEECDDLGCDEDEDDEPFSIAYVFDTQTSTMTIDATTMISDDAGEETCDVLVSMTVSGDTFTGMFESACSGTDGQGLPFSKTEVGTGTATRRVGTAQGSGEGEGEGEGEPPPIFRCTAGPVQGNSADGWGDAFLLALVLLLLVVTQRKRPADHSDSRLGNTT